MNATGPTEYQCPVCAAVLALRCEPGVFVWACDRCGGLLMSVAVLRMIAEDDWSRELWSATADSPPASSACPECGRAMVAAQVGPRTAPVAMDVCRGCLLVWLSAGMIERIPQKPPTPPKEEMSQRSREALAALQVKMIADRYSKQEDQDSRLRWISRVLRIILRIISLRV